MDSLVGELRLLLMLMGRGKWLKVVCGGMLMVIGKVN